MLFFLRWFVTEYRLETTLSSRGPFSPSDTLKGIFSHSFTPEMAIATNDNRGLVSSKWKWLDEWHIQPTISFQGVRKTSKDPDGWFYAINWPNEFYPEKFLTGNVRRRRWERTQREMSGMEIINDLLSLPGSSPSLVMKVLKNGNITNSGEIMFDKVIQEVKLAAASNTTMTSSPGKEMVLNTVTGADSYLRKNESDVANMYSGMIIQTSQKCLGTALKILSVMCTITYDLRVACAINLCKDFAPPQLQNTNSKHEIVDPVMWLINDVSKDENNVEVNMTKECLDLFLPIVLGAEFKVLCLKSQRKPLRAVFRLMLIDCVQLWDDIVELLQLQFCKFLIICYYQ